MDTERVIEATCFTCGADIWSGEGRYRRDSGVYDCEACGDLHLKNRVVSIPRGLDESA